MKVFRKVLYIIAGILVLFTILIVACAYNPNITAAIQGVLFRGKTVEVSEGHAKEEDYVYASDTVSENAPEPEVYHMRSIEELGIDPGSMISDIETYYTNCHDQIVEHGIGEYSFENVIANEALVQEIYGRYGNKDYIDAYMNETLSEIGAGSYEMNLLVEELTDKHFRLTHQIVLREGTPE